MTESQKKNEHVVPVYKRGSKLVSVLATAVVLVIAALVIWQMHSNASHKIDNMMRDSAGQTQTIEGAKRQALAEVSKTDPVGFDLANYMQANYDKIVIVIYFVLAALALAAVARFIMFLVTTSKREQYYPDNQAVDYFVSHEVHSWEEFYSLALAQEHSKSKFWRILRDSAMVSNASGRYDHMYLHFRNRIDRITEYLNEMTLYDSIATASPAAGFFGTLVGLLFIFSQAQGSMAGLSSSPQFAIGMKVAIITSLWGLFNMGLAILSSYFTRRIVDQIHHQMVVRAVAVCEVVESLKVLHNRRTADAPLTASEEEHLRVNA